SLSNRQMSAISTSSCLCRRACAQPQRSPDPCSGAENPVPFPERGTLSLLTTRILRTTTSTQIGFALTSSPYRLSDPPSHLTPPPRAIAGRGASQKKRPNPGPEFRLFKQVESCAAELQVPALGQVKRLF